MNAPEMLATLSPSPRPAYGPPAVQIQNASVVYPAADAPVRALHEVKLDIQQGMQKSAREITEKIRSAAMARIHRRPTMPIPDRALPTATAEAKAAPAAPQRFSSGATAKLTAPSNGSSKGTTQGKKGRKPRPASGVPPCQHQRNQCKEPCPKGELHACAAIAKWGGT